MKKIIVIPSDERQGYIIEYLKSKGYLCEYPKSDNDVFKADAVVLPIPSETDGKIKSTDIEAKDFAKKLNQNCVVFGFCLKGGTLAEELDGRDISYFDVYESEELAEANAVATAQGVLRYILNDSKKLLCETRILLSGYGRTGKAICNTLSANNAKLSVLVRRAEYKSELQRKNISCCFYDENGIGEKYDYIVNTVAAKVIDVHILKTLDKSGEILEIASKPYGIDFEKADSMDLQYVILPSLPSKAAPESAGKFTAIAVEKLIEKNFEEGKTWKC